jgi:hypothetical protein
MLDWITWSWHPTGLREHGGEREHSSERVKYLLHTASSYRAAYWADVSTAGWSVWAKAKALGSYTRVLFTVFDIKMLVSLYVISLK